MNDMSEFLRNIDSEIQELDSEHERVAAKARLEETMLVYEGEDKLISSLEIYDEIDTEPEEEKLYTGITGLDSILDGFRQQQLIVLAAPTKSGKTQFCVELTSRMEDRKPVWLPFEESAKELVRKFKDRNEKPPLFYTPKQMSGNTLDWVEKRVVEGKVKYGSELFFIDHLHFLVPFNSDRLDTRIGDTMRRLKNIAKAHNITIVLISHLKKTKLTENPDLEDLRDSSFIAQEADTVMMLWRETKREMGEVIITNNATLSIQANRRTGNTGNVKLTFNNGRYMEQEWREDEETGICSKCGQSIEVYD